jgi:hypothetical protein
MPYGSINADLIVGTNGGRISPENTFGFRNRIINGAMVIDQRNAGASFTPVDGGFALDRWKLALYQASKITCQQNAGSVTPPVGFANYLGITSSSAYSVLSSDVFSVFQRIEGFNTADLNWGTANAKTVTLSFWVSSSLTGTFGGSLMNSANNRAYPFSYSIPTANTWTPISITIAGDTTGTWVGATNGNGLQLSFGLGVGSTLSGTAGAWSANQYFSATGATSVVGTNGATFYITGVQLEVGSNATSFEYRDYGRELIMCQRYLPAFNFTATNQSLGSGICYSAGACVIHVPFAVYTRVAPTGVSVTGTFNSYTSTGANSGNFTTINFQTGEPNGASLNASGGSGLVGGNAAILLTPAGASQILFTGCEL